jgi:hypothetical protein
VAEDVLRSVSLSTKAAIDAVHIAAAAQNETNYLLKHIVN